ncbi:Ldh family oxidoreductase [Bradyrhizobium sp. CCBAU 53338]|uniref:Ldh family oxidoreductase n=1 Tax=Bradyrhizobium sp. CCBAU 53338 TaxID=1325111 RepID=UPI00188B6939|nr:Ldh family oxidoreductase [Bradyrhizobium sp. CCBAU 53338]QOZ52514.1 Ldh family oxidoreductase [Bradyrhizobium sp. CCBAU 53338]
MAVSNPKQVIEVGAARLARDVASIFVAAGIRHEDAGIVAEDIVAADLEGVPSHGVMLVPMYLDRVLRGSISKASGGDVAVDRGGAVVLDAKNAFGQLTARQAVELVSKRAQDVGLAAVAVRNAFHFGTAGRYARMLADRGCIGIVMSNTRPLMPAPGGAEALVGNNPLAIAIPSGGDHHAEVDLAMSATAMGKIRLAAASRSSIPEGWAADAQGRATTDPAKAIKGMLLPAAGPKGFGLAFMIDMLSGGLSGGAVGAEVRPLYGDPADPYNCSQFFIALNVSHFAEDGSFKARVAGQLERISSSKRAPNVDRIYAPGELVDATAKKSAGVCHLAPETARSLKEAAAKVGINLDAPYVA